MFSQGAGVRKNLGCATVQRAHGSEGCSEQRTAKRASGPAAKPGTAKPGQRNPTQGSHLGLRARSPLCWVKSRPQGPCQQRRTPLTLMSRKFAGGKRCVNSVLLQEALRSAIWAGKPPGGGARWALQGRPARQGCPSSTAGCCGGDLLRGAPQGAQSKDGHGGY